MLVIRKEQMDLFAARETDSFKERMKEHLTEFFPLQTFFAGPSGVEKFIDGGIRESLSLGSDTEATVQSFLDHLILLGADFVRNPLYEKICMPILDPEAGSLIQRHDLMHERTWAYLEKTRGPDGAKLFKAAARLKAWVSKSGGQASNQVSKIVACLKTVFPEKCAAHSEEEIECFCREALSRAQADGFQRESSQAVYAAVAFLAGLGFFHDPLFREALPEQSMALEHETDADERGRILSEASLAYLDWLLSAVRSSDSNMAG